MPIRSDQFRSFIAILLAVVIPFCCCNLRSLLAGNMACPAAGSFPKDGLADASQSPASDHRPTVHGCCHGKSATDGGNSDSEPTNNPSDQPRDCLCDKSGGKMLSVEKPALELPALVAVAVLEWARWPELRPLDPVCGREQRSHAVHRPLTSLVRMHCALNV
ncbi:MAG: hypothetical protein JNK70_09080 [Phycisphaerae bacterium]|nr:hypothetical protein [Phycisphaerae bacterium]